MLASSQGVPAVVLGQEAPGIWRLVEDRRLGSMDEPDYSLTRVARLLVGPEGAIYVLQPVERLIRVYDAAGRYVRTIGRRGSGPGEFQAPRNFGWLGDTLWVADARLDRITLLSRHGDVLGTLRIPRQVSGDAHTPLALLANRSVLAVPVVTAGRMDRTPPALPLLHIDAAGRVRDTLLEQVIERFRLIIRSPTGALRVARQPFDDTPLWEVDPRSRSVTIIEREVKARERPFFGIRRVTSMGETAFSRRYPYDPIPVTGSLADSIVEEVTDDVVRLFGARRDARRAVREELYVPEHVPAVTAVAVDQVGRIWLRRNAIAGRGEIEWTVIGPDGSLLARVLTAKDVALLDGEENVMWATMPGRFDVPYIVRYRISR